MAPTTTCSCPCCCFAPTTTADRSSQGPTRLLSNDFGIKRPTTFRHSSRESVSTGCPPDTSGRGNPLYVAISCRLLYIDGNDFTGHYAWRWEEERWHELLVCALVSSGAHPSAARSAIEILKQLHLDGARALCEGDSETTSQIQGIFARLGLDERAALNCLQQVAQVCMKQWGGLPQVFLRKMGEEAASALTTQLSASGMKSDTAHTLAVLWLQNVCNAPLLASNSP